LGFWGSRSEVIRTSPNRGDSKIRSNLNRVGVENFFPECWFLQSPPLGKFGFAPFDPR
jgi:hypothetical protein